jgi:hypothetical protein
MRDWPDAALMERQMTGGAPLLTTEQIGFLQKNVLRLSI